MRLGRSSQWVDRLSRGVLGSRTQHNDSKASSRYSNVFWRFGAASSSDALDEERGARLVWSQQQPLRTRLTSTHVTYSHHRRGRCAGGVQRARRCVSILPAFTSSATRGRLGLQGSIRQPVYIYTTHHGTYAHILDWAFGGPWLSLSDPNTIQYSLYLPGVLLLFLVVGSRCCCSAAGEEGGRRWRVRGRVL